MDSTKKTGLREKNKNKRYNSILKSARELFIEFGLDDVQMQDIADKEGIGIATLFRYFPKKEKLMVAVAVSILEKEVTTYVEITRAEHTAYEKVAQILDHLIELITNQTKNETLFIEVFESYALFSKKPLEDFEDYMSVRRKIADLFHQVIEQGKTDGSFRSGIDTKETIVAIINSFGLFSRKITLMQTLNFLEADVPSEQQLSIIKEIYLTSLKA